ncbi:MAG: CD1375 family protein [Lachnospira pectinoschiza]
MCISLGARTIEDVPERYQVYTC